MARPLSPSQALPASPSLSPSLSPPLSRVWTGAAGLLVGAAVALAPTAARPQTFQYGTNYSVNQPALPPAGTVLILTIPANGGRAAVEVDNQSAAQAYVVRDDGTGVTYSAIVLASGGVANSQGGSWTSETFRGRVRVYAPAGSQIAAFEE